MTAFPPFMAGHANPGVSLGAIHYP